MGIIHGGQRVAPSQHTSFHHHVYAAPVQAQSQGWVDDVRAREHALQQHEMQLAAHRERIEADRRQAHFEWEQRQMHQAAAQYKYAVEQDATAHTAQFKANLEREASGYKAHLDMEQQHAAAASQQQQVWQQQQQEARTTMDERLAAMRQEERARYNAQLRAAGVDVSAEGDAGVNIPTEGTAENTQLPGSPITSGVGEAPPGSFEDGSTFYTMGSRPMSAPVRHPTPTSPLPQSTAAPLISGYTPTKPPVYGKDGFKERDQQKFAKRFIVYARGQDAISVSSGVRIGTVSMSSCMTAEALAHHARFQFDRPIEDIRETEWEAMFEAAMLIPTSSKAVVVARLKQLSMDNTLLRTSDRMTDWQARYMDILTDEAAEDIDFFHPKAVIQALMYGIKPDGAKALVRNSYDFDDKEIKFNISKFWSHVRGVLSNVLPAMAAEADALRAKGISNKKRAEAVPAPATVLAAEVKRLQDNATLTAAEVNRLTLEARARPAGGGGGGGGCGSRPRAPPTSVSCWSCKGPHYLNDCPTASESTKLAIAKTKRDETRKKPAWSKRLKEPGLPHGTLPGRVNDEDITAMVPVLLDSGVAGGGEMLTASMPQPMEGFGQVPMLLTRYMLVNKIVLGMADGPITLLHVSAWIDETDDGANITLGRKVMETLGYDLEGFLQIAREQRDVWDLADTVATDDSAPTALQRVFKTWHRGTVDEPDPVVDDEDDNSAAYAPDADHDTVVKELLLDAVRAAQANGLSEAGTREVHSLVMAAIDVFRVAPRNEPPVAIEPLKVVLQQGAVPVRCAARRYNPIYTVFLANTVAAWLDQGLAVINPDSHWASAPRVVPKKNGELRLTVDMRGVNAVTLPLVWPMPILDVVMSRLSGKTVFFVGDWFRGFWQLGLHPDCQEWFSVLGVNCVVTPMRVQMGQTDAVAYCQRVAQEVYGEKYGHGLEGWVDDVLGSATDERSLINLLKFLLARCAQYGLKLHPGKCTFYATEIVWCGRRVSAAGISHDPERIAGLTGLSTPTTADQLQQFICALNWMRQSIPQYNPLVAPLQALLEVVCTAAGTRKKTRLASVALADHGWAPAHAECFVECKQALMQLVTLAHPNEDFDFYLCTDASHEFHGAVLTQVPTGQAQLPVGEQDHRPLAFVSGAFDKTQLRWSVTEKEAYAIIYAVKRLDYLLHRARGFTILTDHRNLAFIFGVEPSPDQPRYLADKLARWAVALTCFRYDIRHVPGDENAWGDMLSRWGNRAATVDAVALPWVASDDVTISNNASPLDLNSSRALQVRRLVTVPPVTPSPLGADFEWPTLESLTIVQRKAKTEFTKIKASLVFDNPDGVGRINGCIWIPASALDTQLTLLVIAHAGAMGHRGQAATRAALTGTFSWRNVTEDVALFVRQCLQCMCVGNGTVPRPLGETLHATVPNELIHCDFLSMPDGYIHVIVDDASRFCQLTVHDGCRAVDAIDALQQWFANFGVAPNWASDQGPHYKNQVMEEVRRQYGSVHHFSPAHCPWANGTVEVLMRSVLKTMKTVLAELHVAAKEWRSFVPLVQHSLNHTPSAKLGAGKAPITAMTMLPPGHALSAYRVADEVQEVPEASLARLRENAFIKLAAARDQLHREAAKTSATLRDNERARRNKKPNVKQFFFNLGDYVLVGQVSEAFAKKLQVQWLGPRRIVTIVRDWVYRVEDLRNGAITTHHASRLKFFAARDLLVTQALTDHVAYVEGGHLVECFLDCRFDRPTHSWMLRVKWLGIDILEASWEPAADMATDVPVIVAAYLCKASRGNGNVAKLKTVLAISHPDVV
ncbi:hypothetical protein AaE_013747 [Aphanomyces astaci]|uniref:Integrase catalytic domain-containing protein n=2 Tax=Aphanomyces astaci TaxID=112090 RepID=A0A6A4Z8T2_APHAT|nr:hypothetical protein AaE_013747 [Aphanomyces astaci]